jgi:hypothetical protein
LFHLLQGVFGHTPRNVFLTAETPALCADDFTTNWGQS